MNDARHSLAAGTVSNTLINFTVQEIVKFHVACSNPHRYEITGKSKDCPWRLYATFIKGQLFLISELQI